MDVRDAESLIATAIPKTAGVWADVGAGDGTFTRALLHLLEAGSRIYAIDRDRSALARLARQADGTSGSVIPVVADLAHPFALPGGTRAELDGMVFANSLHYFRDPADVLGRLVAWLGPAGRVVIVEYDDRGPNRWVPYPIPRSALPDLVRRAGLKPPTVTAERPSAYGGTMYVAVAER
jgi:SAM-dependent methyltransferase